MKNSGKSAGDFCWTGTHLQHPHSSVINASSMRLQEDLEDLEDLEDWEDLEDLGLATSTSGCTGCTWLADFERLEDLRLLLSETPVPQACRTGARAWRGNTLSHGRMRWKKVGDMVKALPWAIKILEHLDRSRWIGAERPQDFFHLNSNQPRLRVSSANHEGITVPTICLYQEFSSFGSDFLQCWNQLPHRVRILEESLCVMETKSLPCPWEPHHSPVM